MPTIGEMVSTERAEDTWAVFVTNVDYTEYHGNAVVHVTGRTSDGEFRHIEVRGHQSNFFVKEDDYHPRIENHHAVTGVAFADDDGVPFRSLQGDELVRVETSLPKHVRDVRDLFSETWEADVFYSTRWLIDSGVYTGMEVDVSDPIREYEEDVGKHVLVSHDDVTPLDDAPDVSPRVLAVDIEVDDENGIPDHEEPYSEVLSIVAHDSYTDEYSCWLFDPESRSVDVDADDVRIFRDEKEMFHDFNEYVAHTRPDLLTGWWSSDFDYPYLIERSKELDVWNVQDWSPLESVYVPDSMYRGPRCKGVTFFDMLDGYKKTQIHSLDSKKLDDIAEKELGRGKIEFEGGFRELWERDPETFLEYNIRDVEAVVGIEREQSIVELFTNIRDVTGAEYGDCFNNIDCLDTFFLRRAQRRGNRLPTAVQPDEGWYYGAYVADAVAGHHENVAYLDVSSLYPSIIKMLNVSPETLYGREQPGGESCYSYIDVRPNSVKEETDPDPVKCHFSTEEQGFVSGMVDDMIGLKEEYRGTPKYESVKRITNCFTPDHDVLTPGGVVNIRDLEVGDEVYSLDTEGECVEVKPVTRTFSYSYYDGKVIDFYSDGVSMCVTPNHTILHLQNNRIVKDDADKFTSRERTKIPVPTFEEGKLGQQIEYEMINSEQVIEREANNGVYCVEVEDNHTLLAGRNGNFQFVGQSIYGVLSDSDSYGKGFRLFDWKMGESVTLAGRKIIKHAIEVATENLREQGYTDAEVVVGDTDGFGVTLPTSDSQQEALGAAQEAVESVNEAMPEFVSEQFGVDEDDNEIVLECESLASDLYIPFKKGTKRGSKKKYAQTIVWDDDSGWIDDPSEKIKGFAYVRSDTAQVTSEAQKTFLDLVLSEDVGTAHNEFSRYLNELVDDIESGEYPVEKLGRPRGVGQPLCEYGDPNTTPQPTYRGAKYANEHVYNDEVVGEGSNPTMFYLNGIGGDYPTEYNSRTGEDGEPVDAIALDDPSDLPDEADVDIDKMLEKTVFGALQSMASPPGWDLKEMVSDTEQETLDGVI